MVRYFPKLVPILAIVLATHVTLALAYDESLFTSTTGVYNVNTLTGKSYYTGGYHYGITIPPAVYNGSKTQCMEYLANQLAAGNLPNVNNAAYGTYGVYWDNGSGCGFLYGAPSVGNTPAWYNTQSGLGTTYTTLPWGGFTSQTYVFDKNAENNLFLNSNIIPLLNTIDPSTDTTCSSTCVYKSDYFKRTTACTGGACAPAVNCAVSGWSAFSTCSSTGSKTRTRTITHAAVNGG